MREIQKQHGQHLEVAIKNVYEARYPANTTIGEISVMKLYKLMVTSIGRLNQHEAHV